MQRNGGLGGAAGRRVLRGSETYGRGIAPVVVVSGGRRWHGCVEADVMRDALVALGVPDSAIIREMSSLNTAQNAAYVTRLSLLRGWRHLAIVTCHWHLPRAVSDFQTCCGPHGIKITAIAAASGSSSLVDRVHRAAKEAVCLRLDAIRLRAIKR